jgi:hypothetical protein
VNPPRQFDLEGSISAVDAAGRTVQVRCAGAWLSVDASSARAALSALSAVRALRAANASDALAPSLQALWNDYRVELRLGGRLIGRAGFGARANWLGHRLTRLPLELHASALLRAALRAF